MNVQVQKQILFIRTMIYLCVIYYWIGKIQLIKSVYSQYTDNFKAKRLMYSSFCSPSKYAKGSIQMPKKWPQDIELVIKSQHHNKGSVYISNIEAAQNLQTLKKRGIRSILSCAKGYKVAHPTSEIPHYKYVPTQDKQSYDLTPHFQECADFIKKALQQTNILVHCIAGVSRSVSMVIAYLMKHQGMGYDEAYYLIKARRKIISPNEGFIVQLKKYHAKLNGKQFIESPKKIKPKQQPYIRGRQKPQSFTVSQPFISYKSQQKDKKSQLMRNYDRYAGNYQYLKKSDDFKRAITYDLGGSSYAGGLGLQRTIDPYSRKEAYPKSMSKINYQYATSTAKNISTQTPVKKTYDLENDQKLERTQTTNDKYNTIAYNSQYRTPDRKGYFDAMNSELNQKIQAIRDKYEKQRQDLLKSSAKTVATGNYGSSHLERRYQNQSKILSSAQKLYQSPGVVSQSSRARGYSAKNPSRMPYDQKKQRQDEAKDVNSRYQDFLRNKFETTDNYRKYDVIGRHNHYYGHSRRPLYNF